jgi:hypothetical protein
MPNVRRVAPVLIPLMLLVVTGFRGINYGEHWDEWVHVKGVRQSVLKEVPLPGVYPYPSVSYWLMMVSATPNIISYALSDADSKDPLLAEIEGDAFSLKARSVFLITSAMAIVFVYGTVLAWRDRVLEALLAATIFGLSWEFAYHARYIAPDCVGVTFGALAILGCIGAHRHPESQSWLWGGPSVPPWPSGRSGPSASSWFRSCSRAFSCAKARIPWMCACRAAPCSASRSSY